MDFNISWRRSKGKKLGYLRRDSTQSVVYRLVYWLHEELERVWEERYQPLYGRFRREVREALYKFLDCGVLVHGCARAWCKSCNHSELIPLSCKTRGICASCDTKRKLLFAEHLHEEVLEDAPVRHVVFSVPKRIRTLFRYNRSRNWILFRAAWESLSELFLEIAPQGIPGAVMAIHTAGQFGKFNPHIHGLAADGVVLPDGAFQQIELSADKLQRLFEHKVLSYLRGEGLVCDTVIAQLRSWTHSGFSAWVGPSISASDTDARLFISEYVNKAQVNLSKLQFAENPDNPDELVLRCRSNDGTTKDYDPLDFLALITTHIAKKWEQTVRYFGWFSARTRGKRNKLALAQPAHAQPLTILPQKPEQKRRASRSWARLIRKVYEADPLICSKCGGLLKVIAVITNPKQAMRISAHLGIRYRAPPPLGVPKTAQTRFSPLPKAA